MNTPDDPLISVTEMARQAGVTRSTMSNYRSEGRLPPPDDTSVPDRPRWRQSTFDSWLASRPGRGTRTDLAAPVRIRIGRIRGDSVQAAHGPWREACRAVGLTPSVTVTTVERQTVSGDVAGKLGTSEAVYRCRDCLADEIVIQHQEAWHPASIIPAGSILDRPEPVRGGVANALTQLGHRPATVVEEVYARAPTRSEAALFRSPLRIPVIVTERLSRDEGGMVVEFLRITSAGDRTILVYEGSPTGE